MSVDGWKQVKLGDIISFKNGRKKPNGEGSIPIYGGNGILGYTNESNNEDVVVEPYWVTRTGKMASIS